VLVVGKCQDMERPTRLRQAIQLGGGDRRLPTHGGLRMAPIASDASSRRRIPLSASRSVPRDRGAAILRLVDRPAGALPEPGTTPHSRGTPQPRSRTWSTPRLHQNCPPGGRFGPLNRRSHTRKSSLSWSPLTESNRRPSPYHVSLRSSVTPGRASDLREHEHTLALTSARQAHASAICHSICHSL
jgi:hypothetical protein